MNARAIISSLLPAGLLLMTVACGREEEAPRTSIVSADSGAPMANMPHGNHDPKYGGVVMMNGELHFEMVAKPDGSYKVYFSDYARRELPASSVSNVSLAIKRPGFRAEPVDMRISATGEYWEGQGGSVDDKDTDIRVNFTYQGKPLFTDLPFFVPSAAKAVTTSSPK